MPSSIFWKTEKGELFNDQNSIWTSVEAGVLQGSDMDLLLLSIFINDLIKYQMQKLFANDTSLFCVIKNANLSAKDMNNDPAKISNWTFQWKVSFNREYSFIVCFVIASKIWKIESLFIKFLLKICGFITSNLNLLISLSFFGELKRFCSLGSAYLSFCTFPLFSRFSEEEYGQSENEEFEASEKVILWL